MLYLIMDGQRNQVCVIGTAISPEFIYCTPTGSIVSQPKNFGIFFMKRDYMEDVFGFHGAFNNVVGLLRPDARRYNPSAVLKQLTDALDNNGVFTSYLLKNQFSNATLTSEMSGVQSIATFLPIMFLEIAALILNVLMVRIAEQQRTIVGTLKALGYFNKQIFWHYIQFGVVVGALGASIVVMAFGLTNSMDKMLSFQFDKIMRNDFSISFRNEQPDEALDMARCLPGVLKAESLFNVAGTFVNKNHRKKGVITGLLPDGTMTVPHDAAGNAVPVPSSDVLLTVRMARLLDVQEGDTIRFTPVKGIRNEHEIKVVKIIKSMLGLVVCG